MDIDRYRHSMERLVKRAGLRWLGHFMAVGADVVHYVDAGPTDGTPVVLLHGFGAWSFTWRRNVEPLAAAGFRVLVPDLRGFGLTTKPLREAYGLWDQARLVLRWLDVLGVRTAVLGGNSLGGEISLRVALLAPGRVQGLLLASSAGYVPMRMPRLAHLAVRAPRLAAPVARALWANTRFIGAVVRAAYYDPSRVTDEDIQGYALPAYTPGAATGLLVVLRQLDPGTTASQFGSIRKPALLIWGRHDPWTPLEHGEQLARDLGGARLEVFDDAAHLPHEEKADAFNRLAVHWLRDLTLKP